MASSKALHHSMLADKFVISFLITIGFALLGTTSAMRTMAIHGVTDGSAGKDLVRDACHHTLYFNECVSSLRSDPRSGKISDVTGLAAIALDLSIEHAKETLSYFKKLKKTQGKDKDSKKISKCLTECVEEYSDALDSLRQSVGADLRNKDSNNLVNTLVSTAMTDSETCEDDLMELVPDYKHSPQLSDRNQYFYMLCSNFLAITTIV